MLIIRRSIPFAVLAVLGLIYFTPLVMHPSHTLYSDHSDLIALHVPWVTFLARSCREFGEVPLWNPLQFVGLPFAHDIQAAISYPPHWLFRVIHESRVGSALSWLIVVHIIFAGWGMFAHARSRELGTTASLVSAVGFMFAGKWLIHLTLAGHYAFIGLAWLPWTLLGLERAIRNRDILAALWAGTAFGMMALSTHPQLTLYSGLFLAVWTFSFVLDTGCSGVLHRLARWAGFGLLTAVVALAIGSVQLLSSLESTPLASRGVTALPESPSLSLHTILRTYGPSPEGVQAVISWEPRCGFGVVWIAAAVIAPMVTTGTARRQAKWALGILVGLSVFSLGGAVLIQGLPIFRMFRQPARMFLVASLPLTYMVSLTTQALIERTSSQPSVRVRAQRTMVIVFAILVTLLTAAAFSVPLRNLKPQLYWFSLVGTIPLAVWLVGRNSDQLVWRVAWVSVLFIDLVAQTWPYVRTCDLNRILAPSAAARYVANNAGPLDRSLDRHTPGQQSTTPLGPAVASRFGLHTVRGYNPLDLVRFKEYFAFVSDPVMIRHPYNGVINAPIFHKALLDLLGVRFLVQPSDSSLRSVPCEPSPDFDPSWRKVFDDPSSTAFSFAAGGVQTLPAYEVLENTAAFPRAFVVPIIASLPADRAEIVRVMTSTDFHRVAFVEPNEPLKTVIGQGEFHSAIIRSYSPNRTTIDAEGPGLLVLTDPWYPGWTATVDGHVALIYRTNTLFRGVDLSSGKHSVAFAFQPKSYATGLWISRVAWVFVGAATAIRLALQRRKFLT